jgi:hypothetical protein
MFLAGSRGGSGFRVDECRNDDEESGNPSMIRGDPESWRFTGMTRCDYGHLILWSWTQIQSSSQPFRIQLLLISETTALAVLISEFQGIRVEVDTVQENK